MLRDVTLQFDDETGAWIASAQSHSSISSSPVEALELLSDALQREHQRREAEAAEERHQALIELTTKNRVCCAAARNRRMDIRGKCKACWLREDSAR